ncbi:SIS domain-containing protein [Streptomyces sp. SPB074]|uniref:SIS domain-containing protein n=1 Tax=Streptomyces sp. (strain SPB074) TaxID=465543 RepID=UPI00017F1253|nr:SIS domain-containing protein [Streptomyces sp. SPB074]
MPDDLLLDDPAALARADPGGLLPAAASAGALVRTAQRLAAEAGLTSLKPEGRPRSILLATSGPAAETAADVTRALAAGSCPVLRLAPTGVAAASGALRWTLPGWAGPVDLLLIATPDGSEPGLRLLAEQAYRRGPTVVAVLPRRSALGEVVDGSRGLPLPLATLPDHEETVSPWPFLVPLLGLLDRTGLLDADEETVQRLADRLDATAERCGPITPTGANPAKSLALELDESLPLLWTEGPAADAVARRLVRLLAARAGRPALTAALPEALTAHAALLSRPAGKGDDDPDDFFRDRVEDTSGPRPRVVLLRTRTTEGLTAAPAVRELAHAHRVPLTELALPEGPDLDVLAELLALTEYTAAYLSLSEPA